jgi:hypothetical protein
MTITKEDIYSELYKLFYNILNSNIDNPRDNISLKYWVYPEYPENIMEDSSYYPLLVIEGIDFDYDHFTFTENEYDVEVRLHLFSAGGEASKKLDKLASSVFSTLEKNTDSFEDSGVEDLQKVADRRDRFERGPIYGKFLEQTWSCKVYLDKLL